MNDSDQQAHPEPIILVGVASEFQAKLIVDALVNEGIEAMSAGGETAGLRNAVPGDVRILVRETDLTHARQVLEAFLNDSATDVDWEHTDLGTPEE